MSDERIKVNKIAYSTFITTGRFPEITAEQQERWRVERLAQENHIRVGLAAAPEPLRPIIELHSNKRDECQGCDGAGEWNPEWPCRTIQLIADTYDHDPSA